MKNMDNTIQSNQGSSGNLYIKSEMPVSNSNLPVIRVDLTIIGAGMAGLSAAVFALNRGISTLITGKRGSMNFATGLMDLMGVHPSGREWDNPWEAIERVRRDIPGHPYCAINDEELCQSLGEVVDFLRGQNLNYSMRDQHNVNVITSLGTMKKSYIVPESMWKGVTALEGRAPSLIVDFAGMKIFSARQIVSTISSIWPKLQSARIEFPGMENLEEVYPEHIARALDVEANRISLAELVKPLLGSGQYRFEYVGFPALLGMYRSEEAIDQLEQLLGVPVFEIPTPPVSVPGIRLHEALTQGLSKNSKLISITEMVQSVKLLQNRKLLIKTGSAEDICTPGEGNSDGSNQKIRMVKDKIVESRAVILATGRFMGRGLTAKRTGICESLLNLPVTQPEEREMWHHKDLFCPRGHPVNRAGIEIDSMMRPLLHSGKPFAQNLFAAGSILAHSDWTRMKCGSGVAIATAFAAVKSVESVLNQRV